MATTAIARRDRSARRLLAPLCCFGSRLPARSSI